MRKPDSFFIFIVKKRKGIVEEDRMDNDAMFSAPLRALREIILRSFFLTFIMLLYTARSAAQKSQHVRPRRRAAGAGQLKRRSTLPNSERSLLSLIALAYAKLLL
jgi:hypothetical protein